MSIQNNDVEIFNKSKISTELLTASYSIATTDLVYIKHLLDNGADINAQDHNGNTALHVSSARGNSTIVEFLLQKKADISLKNKNGLTPYQLAILNNQTNIAYKIRDSEISILEKGLLKSIEANDYNSTEYYIKSGSKVNFYDYFGRPPLSVAILESNYDIVNLLLENGANPHLKDEDESTSLHYAVTRNDLSQESIALKLIEKGIDPNLHLEDDYPILFKAVFMGYEKLVNRILPLIKNVNEATYDYQVTPLHVAFAKDNLKIAKLLLAHGADLFAQNKGGGIPIDFSKNSKLCKKLLTNDSTKFISAAANGRIDILEKLVEKNVDVNAKGYFHETALSLASKFCHINVIKFLFDHGAKISYGLLAESPLHFAARSNCSEAITILLDNGGNLNEANLIGITPANILEHLGYPSNIN